MHSSCRICRRGVVRHLLEGRRVWHSGQDSMFWRHSSHVETPGFSAGSHVTFGRSVPPVTYSKSSGQALILKNCSRVCIYSLRTFSGHEELGWEQAGAALPAGNVSSNRRVIRAPSGPAPCPLVSNNKTGLYHGNISRQGAGDHDKNTTKIKMVIVEKGFGSHQLRPPAQGWLEGRPPWSP